MAGPLDAILAPITQILGGGSSSAATGDVFSNILGQIGSVAEQVLGGLGQNSDSSSSTSTTQTTTTSTSGAVRADKSGDGYLSYDEIISDAKNTKGANGKDIVGWDPKWTNPFNADKEMTRADYSAWAKQNNLPDNEVIFRTLSKGDDTISQDDLRAAMERFAAKDSNGNKILDKDRNPVISIETMRLASFFG